MLPNNQWNTEEIKEEIKKYLETNDNENTMIQKPVGCRKSSSKREVHSNSSSPQEIRKISKNLTLHLKQLKKKNNENPKLVETQN